MSGAFTAKVHQIDSAPRRIALLGEKTKRPESAQHVIEFPGGAVEVSRCSDGSYWAHILVNRGEAVDDCEGFRGRRGEVVGSRIGRSHPHCLTEIADAGDVEQIAVLIRTEARS